MKEVIKYNLQFFAILISWVFVAFINKYAAFAYILLFIFVFKKENRYTELFIGFLLILILSDNLEPQMAFAKSFKNIYVVLLAFFFFIDRKNFTPIDKTFTLFLPFIFIGAFCLIYSPVLATSSQKLVSYALLLIIVPNYVVKMFKENGTQVFKTLTYFLLFIIIIGYLFKYISLETAISHGGRLRGIFGNPNGLGVFLILFFCFFTLINNLYPSLFSRVEKLLIYLVIIFCCIKTGSRTSLMAILLAIIFIRVYRISPFLGFLVFLVALFSTELILANYVQIITFLGLQDTFRLDTIEEGSGRLIAWAFAWENIKESLYIGKGFAYDEYLMRQNFDELSQLGHEGGVHNTYLIIWLNTGLAGLVFFIRAYILKFTQAAKRTPMAIPIMFTIFFSVNFEPWLASSLNPFTILALILLTIMSNDEIIFEINQDEAEEKVVVENLENETN